MTTVSEFMKMLGLLGYPASGKKLTAAVSSSLPVALAMTTANTNTTYATQLATFNIPAGALTTHQILQIALAGTNNNSSNVKSWWIEVGGVKVGPTVTNSTNTSLSGTLSISNNGAMNSQAISASFSSGTASTGWAANTSFDMTKRQQVVIMGQLASMAAGETMQLTSATATLGTAPTLTTLPNFYGVNGHYTYTATPAQIIAAMKLIGATMYRFDVYPDVPQSLVNAAAMATAFQQDGTVQMYCLIGCSMESNPATHTAYTSEAAAYAATKAFATQVVNTLYPLGVNIYECGNELDAASAGGVSIRPTTASQGTVSTDFVNSVWPLFRGVVCGMIDGVHAANPAALAGSNAFTNGSIWAAYALFNGLQPDGTSGYMQMRPDFLAWHFYTQGDATNVPYSGGGGQPQLNLLQYLAQNFGIPLVISEWHPSQGTDAANATVCAQYLNTWYSNRAKYNIAGTILYSLYDNPWYVIPAGAGSTTLNALGTAYQSFIAAHKG